MRHYEGIHAKQITSIDTVNNGHI